MQTLIQLLTQMHDTLRQLEEKMQTEQQALLMIRHPVSSLHEIIQHKKILLAKLKEFDLQRLELETPLNITAPYENTLLAPQWEQIKILTAKIAQLNNINGMLLIKWSEHTESAIEILKQLTQSDLYGADGQQQNLMTTFKHTAI